MKIVCISGKAESGKTTFAEAAKEEFEKLGKKALIFHYADYLKFIAAKYFGYDGDKTKPEMRSLLQHLGTEVFRSNRPDCWTTVARAFIDGLGDTIDYVLIPDTRFESEITWMAENGYNHCTVRIVRPNHENKLNAEQRMHASETELDGYPFDFYIQNEGDMELLRQSANTFVKYIVEGE